MLNLPLVSICIPIYGVEDYIEKCLHSLFRQTYNNLEFIFVNDNSKDKSIQILNKVKKQYPKWESNIKIISHQKNLGLAASRLTALKNSNGEFIYHVDSDDWLEVDAIEKLVNTAIKENSDIVTGNHRLISSNLSKDIKIKSILSKQDYIEKLLKRKYGYPLNIWNRLIRRVLHLKVLPIPGLNFGEDWVTIPRLLYYAEKISFCEDITYNYKIDNYNSYSRNISPEAKDNLINATLILNDFFSKNSQSYSQTLEIMKDEIKLFFYKLGNNNYNNDIRLIFGKDFFKKYNYFNIYYIMNKLKINSTFHLLRKFKSKLSKI